MIDSQNTPGDKAVLSTLFNIERFVLDAKNIKIFLNLLLYGLEEPEMMKPISQFFRKHLEIYKMIIEKAKADLPKINKNEFDMAFHARITQIIFLSTGLMEAVDPTGMDPAKLARYVLSLFDE